MHLGGEVYYFAPLFFLHQLRVRPVTWCGWLPVWGSCRPTGCSWCPVGIMAAAGGGYPPRESYRRDDIGVWLAEIFFRVLGALWFFWGLLGVVLWLNVLCMLLYLCT